MGWGIDTTSLPVGIAVTLLVVDILIRIGAWAILVGVLQVISAITIRTDRAVRTGATDRVVAS